MDTTNYINPNANYFKMSSTPLVNSAISPTTPLDATTLTNIKSLNLQPQTTTPTPDITTIPTTQITKPAEQSTKAKTLTDRLSSLFSGPTKEQSTQDQITLQTQPYQQQLNEIETQIKMQQAKAIQNQELAMQRGETLGFASREAQNIARTDAIETLKLSALAEGMRGNIALAEQQAIRAINAQFAERDKEIEQARQNIYDNYDSFSPAEKKKADATLLRLDKDDAFVKERKEDAKITQGFIQEAIAQSAKNGVPIPTLILQRANQVETPTEALQILAPYMVDANEKAIQLEELRNKRLVNQKLQIDIDNLKNVPGITGVSPYQIERQTRILDSVDDLIKRAPFATGVLSVYKFIPGSFQKNFKADLDTLKANIAFGELQAMRDASKTGGALGAISEKELNLLESAMAGLDQAQSPGNFKKNMSKIKESIERWNKAVSGQNISKTVIMTSPDGKQYNVPADKVELFKQNGYK